MGVFRNLLDLKSISLQSSRIVTPSIDDFVATMRTLSRAHVGRIECEHSCQRWVCDQTCELHKLEKTWIVQLLSKI